MDADIQKEDTKDLQSQRELCRLIEKEKEIQVFMTGVEKLEIQNRAVQIASGGKLKNINQSSFQA